MMRETETKASPNEEMDSNRIEIQTKLKSNSTSVSNTVLSVFRGILQTVMEKNIFTICSHSRKESMHCLCSNYGFNAI